MNESTKPEVKCADHARLRRDGASSFLLAWAPLLLLQALLSALILYPFIKGDLYFAFLDIGSDTYVNSAIQMSLARLFTREGFSGWSFAIGLGAPVPFALNDIVGHLSGIAGPDHVLQLRIWIYLLKITLAGLFFYLLARAFTRHEASALIGALGYSFCGYIVTNGTWDSETGLYVFAPLILLGALRFFRQGDRVTFPLAVGVSLLSGVFFLLVAVSLIVTCALCVAASESRRETARVWITRLMPLAALGFILGAPYALPMALQLLDSPRVSGSVSMLERFSTQALAFSDASMLLAQVGGLFHKDIFGIGSLHSSYMNYLESPGFYVGVLPLVLLPQLWRGSPLDRRMLVVGVVALIAYFLLPGFRLSAYGFAAPYFRGTTLWISVGILLLGSRALALVLDRGVDGAALAAGIGLTGALLTLVVSLTPASGEHVLKVAIILATWGGLMALTWKGTLGVLRLQQLVLGLLIVELVVIAVPSFVSGRIHATDRLNPHKDFTLEALAAIRADGPPQFYRVEKTFDSFGHSDALAQDYRGVKSYYYHGRAVVQFHQGMGLMHEFNPRPTNYTNWLPGPGDRFVLLSALGARYIISKTPLDWPGLSPVGAGTGWFAYRNELALPLGVVHSKQVTAAEMQSLTQLPPLQSRWAKDLTLMNAVILDKQRPELGTPIDVSSFLNSGELNVDKHYAEPARALQRTGLQVTQFSEDRILGTIHPEAPGLLVFSIPAYAGWTLHINGQPVALTTANFGMLAAPVQAGAHQVELTYSLPGLKVGLWLSLAGLLLLLTHTLSPGSKGMWRWISNRPWA